MRTTFVSVIAVSLFALSSPSLGQDARLDEFNKAIEESSLTGDDGAIVLYETLRGKIPAEQFVRSGQVLAAALEALAADTFATYANYGITSGGPATESAGSSVLLAPSADELTAAADALDQVIALRGVTHPDYPRAYSNAQLFRGWAALRSDRFEDAVALLENVDPPTALSTTAIGFAYYHLNKSEAAAEQLARAVEMAPTWSEVRRYQGFVAQYEGDWEQALAFYTSAAELNPGDPYLQVDIGEIHAESGDLITAMEAWRRALDLDTEGMVPIIAGFILERLVVADREELAESIYTEAIMRQPENPGLLVERGDFYRMRDHFEKAEADFREALRHDKDYVAAHNGLGLMYEQQEDYDKALRAYRRAARLEPDRAYPFRNLGDVYAAQEKYEDAIEAYEKAIENESDATGAIQGLAQTYVNLEQFELAEVQFLKYAEISGDSAAYNDLGIFYEVHVARYRDALSAYEKARELGATAEIIANVGDANRRLGNYHIAAAAYHDALRLDPSQAYALEGLNSLEDHAVVPRKDRSVDVITGRLERDGEQLEDGSLFASHTLFGKAGDEWTILLRSDAFDPFLMVYGGTEDNRIELARDDDSGLDTDASLSVTLPQDGHYSVVANSYDSGDFGDYEIVLLRSRAEKPRHGEEQVFRSELTDSATTMDDDSFYNVHIIPARLGEALDITLASAAFDGYLFLLDPDGDVLFEDDDSASGTNANGSFKVPVTGDYTAIVNTVEPGQVGPYSLVVRRGTPEQIFAVDLGREQIDGELTSSSERMNDDSRFNSHIVSGSEGDTLNLTMQSQLFDAYLFVFDSNGNVLAEDDDSAGGTNAGLSVTLPADGDYVVVANSVGNEALGPYTIELRRN